jgi:hypothetical protein
MTARCTAGSKAPAARGRAALERWAKRRLNAAREGVAAAVREHFAAGRPIVFEKNGRIYLKTSARAKAQPLRPTATEKGAVSSASGFAESETPKYTKAPKKKSRRAKSR